MYKLKPNLPALILKVIDGKHEIVPKSELTDLFEFESKKEFLQRVPVVKMFPECWECAK